MSFSDYTAKTTDLLLEEFSTQEATIFSLTLVRAKWSGCIFFSNASLFGYY